MGGFITLVAFVVIALALTFYTRKLQQGGFTKAELVQLRDRVILAVAVLIVLGVLVSSIVVVPVGTKMVVFNRFSKEFTSPLDAGIGFVLPGVYERINYDIRTQVYTMSGVIAEGDVARSDSIEVLSSDGLRMDLDITVQYHLAEDGLNTLHGSVGANYVDKIIRPTVRESIRNEFAQYEATEAYSTKREIVKQNLFARLDDALAEYNMVLEEVLLRNIALPATVVAAIEEKKAAQQDAERMQYVLEKETQEKERVIIEAEAQAERIQIVNEALAANPNYLNWLAIDKLNDNIQLVISDGKTILNLDAMKSN